MRLKKWVKVTIFLFIILAVGAASLLTINFMGLFDSKKNNNPETKKEVEVVKEDPIKIYKASLVATGDGLIHSPIYKSVYDSATGTYDFKDILTYIKEEIKDYDLKYYNQETVFGGKEIGYSSYPCFNTQSEYGDAMIDAGFNLVSLATNHSYDRGRQASLNSINYWKQQENVLTAGMYADEEDKASLRIGEVNNIKYGFLSYTTVTNGLFNANIEPLISYFTKERAQADVQALKDAGVDIIIVAIHWGTEYVLDPVNEQVDIANYLSELGVNIVLGTHSHCVEPVTKIGDTIVFYSLGNFLSNQGDLYSTIRYKGVVGMLGSLEITKTVNTDLNTTEISIGNVGVDLTYTYNKNHTNYKVIPFSKMTTDYLANYLDVYQEYKKVVTKLDPEGTLVNVKLANGMEETPDNQLDA